MTQTNTNNRPSHRAYAISGPEDHQVWTEIGALWPHQDAKGFNLDLTALPVDGRIVIRVPQPRKSKGTSK